MKIYDCEINCSGEIISLDDAIGIEFGWELWFDVQKFFGVVTGENEWVNMYTKLMRNGDVKVDVFVDTDFGDMKIDWEPDDDELCFLREKMEDYCYKLYGKGADDILDEIEVEFAKDKVAQLLMVMLRKVIGQQYVKAVFDAIVDDVILDVAKHSRFKDDGEFTYGNVMAALGKVLKDKLCK